jgi:hypothetical protein
MTIFEIYDEIIKINERVLLGSMTIQQAHIRVEVLSLEAYLDHHIDIDVLKVIGAIEEQLLTTQEEYLYQTA